MHQTIGLIKITTSVIFIIVYIKDVYRVEQGINLINFARYVSRGRQNTAAKAAFIKEK